MQTHALVPDQLPRRASCRQFYDEEDGGVVESACVDCLSDLKYCHDCNLALPAEEEDGGTPMQFIEPMQL